jgi:hypothetical protein
MNRYGVTRVISYRFFFLLLENLPRKHGRYGEAQRGENQFLIQHELNTPELSNTEMK